MAERPSEAVQDYLKAIHRLGGGDEVVSPDEIADGAGGQGPVGHRHAEAARGRRLDHLHAEVPARSSPPAGLAEALRVIRRHRLVELFLTRVLGLDWSEVDAEAEALEHAISPRLEQAIADHLGEPLEDPHGHPIPSQHRRTPPPRASAAQRVPRRADGRHPRGAGRQPGPAAPLAGPRA